MSGNPRPTFDNIVNIADGTAINASDAAWNMSYLVYSDPYEQFTDFYNWVNDSNTFDEQDYDIVNANKFSNYVLKLECNFVNAATPSDMACCVASSDKGGYCIKAGDTGAEDMTTYALTAAQVTTLTGSNTLDAAAAITYTDEEADKMANEKYFNWFGCDGSQDYRYTCYKFMPAYIRPETPSATFVDTSVDGSPRLGTQEAADGNVKAIWFDGSTADSVTITEW